MTPPSLETLVRAREAAAWASRARYPWVTDQQGGKPVIPAENPRSADGNAASRNQPHADQEATTGAQSRSQAVVVAEIPVETLGSGVVTLLGDAVALVVDGRPVSSKTGLKRMFFGAGQVVRGTAGIVIGVLGCLGCVVVCVGKTVIGSSRISQVKQQ